MNGVFILGMIIFFVMLLIFMPLLVLWALNTLFAIPVAYDMAHWFAVVVLVAAVGGFRAGFSSKKDG